MDYRLGAKADGTLTGLHLRVVANTGAYDSDGYNIPGYALVAGGGPYRWQAVDARAWSVYTNGPKAGQMRGFGTPQSNFALECTLDELAVRLGIDPLELRLQNAIEDAAVTFLGYPPAETVGYRQCLEAIRPHYQAAMARMEELKAGACGQTLAAGRRPGRHVVPLWQVGAHQQRGPRRTGAGRQHHHLFLRAGLWSGNHDGHGPVGGGSAGRAPRQPAPGQCRHGAHTR